MPDLPASVVQIERLQQLATSELEPAAAVLIECFNPSNDPISQQVYRDVPDVTGYNALRMRSRLYASVRDLDVTIARADEGVGAVMIVNPPGTMDLQAAPTPYSSVLFQRITPEAAAVEKELLFDTLHAFESRVFGNEGYYISFLCTSPAARRRGLAGALVKQLLREAEGVGRSVYLTTQNDQNIKFYSSLGFHVLEETSIDVRGEPMRFVAMSNRDK